jgi:hypothetical protein
MEYIHWFLLPSVLQFLEPILACVNHMRRLSLRPMRLRGATSTVSTSTSTRSPSSSQRLPAAEQQTSVNIMLSQKKCLFYKN